MGLTKYIGKLKAEQMPLITPKDWPKLNILVTPCPGIALTCSTTTIISLSSFNLSLIILVTWEPFTCFLFFFPSIMVGMSKTSIIFLFSKTLIAPLTPGSIPKIITLKFSLENWC